MNIIDKKLIVWIDTGYSIQYTDKNIIDKKLIVWIDTGYSIQ